PNMIVVNPCDFNQTKMATIAVAEHVGPAYLRFGRPSVPNFTPENEPLIIGKAKKMQEGSDVSVFATGHLVYHALEAAYILSQEGISVEVINIHTIKPLDDDAILKSVTKTGCVVTAEEHLMNGGLGDSVCQLLARKLPTPVEMVAVDDKFGESGTPEQLMKKYGLDTPHVVEAIRKVIARK
ncbi:transketolase family protein, partial [Bacteroidales bacterium OttesenSCG-928-L19]|nr:transketolase family protein [Bacteroidales bacterium OttesenSCG-928-L19]